MTHSSARASLRIDRSIAKARPAVHFTFDGQTVAALSGDTVGVALWAAGEKLLRLSPNAGTPRGLFCVMGSCQECAVLVNGVIKTSCNTVVEPGLDVRSIGRRGPVAT